MSRNARLTSRKVTQRYEFVLHGPRNAPTGVASPCADCLQCYGDASHLEILWAWAELPEPNPEVRRHIDTSVRALTDRLNLEAKQA